MEIWKPLQVEHFEDFYISNLGRLRSHKGKIRKPIFNQGVWKFDVRKKINGETYRLLKSVGRLVYTYFSDKDISNKLVRRKDRQGYCGIDNLRVNQFVQPTAEQIQLFNDYFYKFVKSEIMVHKYNDLKSMGFDLDNCIQQTALNLYEWIGSTQIKSPKEFWVVVKKQLRWCILQNLKRWHKHSELWQE